MYQVFLILLIWSQQVCSQNGKLLNIALFSTQTLIDEFSDATNITGYTTQNTNPLNLTLGRINDPGQTIFTVVAINGTGDQTRITNFPAGTRTATGEDSNGDFLTVTIPTDADVSEKTGVFSFRVANDDGSAHTAIVILTSSATIVPMHRTMTSGLGDRVTIQMHTAQSTYDLRWRHNYGDVITEWNGLSNVTIDVVRLKDGGVYECYHQETGTDGNHGITRLIVRGCPSSRWNPPVCDMYCPVCYNGGVCDDVTGLCICLSGFGGQYCSIVCSADTFGRDCLFTCPSDSCRGALICPSDPAGCSCGNGYGGIDCTKPCDDGWYGAGCNQMCNCNSASCDKRAGCIGNCLPGYTGPQCQELTDSPCPDGFYGNLCNHQCHCAYSATCAHNGACALGCDQRWDGDDCSIALAVLSHPPRVVSRTSDSITIDFTWSPTEDYGTGDVQVNLLWFNSSADLTLNKIHVFSNLYTIEELPADSLVTFYVEHIQVVNGHNYHGPVSPTGTAVTTCSEPLDAPSIVHISSRPNEITVTLQGVSERIERILCDQIVRYDVRYKSADGTNETTIPVDYDFDKQITIRDFAEACAGYQIDARVVNNEGFKGPWSDAFDAAGTIPAPIISNWSYTSEDSVRVSWQAVKCSSSYSSDKVKYYYEVPGSGLGGETYETEVVLGSVFDPCTYYTFNINASFEDVMGPRSSISFITEPPAPIISDWSYTSGDSVRVSWQAVKCSSLDSNSNMVQYYYEVPGSGLEGETYETEVVLGSVFDPCTYYTFNVNASFEDVMGPRSSISFITEPPAPIISDWSYTSGDSVRVSWQAVKCSSLDSNSNMVQYYYEVPGSGLEGETYETEVVLGCVFDPCTYYTFNIYASFPEVNGPRNSISFITKPLAPYNFKELDVEERSFTVKWETSNCSKGVDLSYNYQLNHGGVTLMESSTTDTELVFDDDLTPCTEYSLIIFAFFDDVIGASASYIVMTDPGAPSIKSVYVTASSMSVNWLVEDTCNITQCRVVLSDERGTVAEKTTNQTFIEFNEEDGVSANTQYTIKVAASTDKGYGQYSSLYHASTNPVTASTTSSVVVSTVVTNSTTDGPPLVGGDIIAIVVGGALVVILGISCIHILRSRHQHKDDGHSRPVMVNLQQRYSKDEYSMSNSTTHDTFTDNNSSSYTSK